MSLIHFLKNILLHQQEKEEYLIEKNRQRAQRGKLQKKNKHTSLCSTLPASHNEFHFWRSNWQRLKPRTNSL